MANKQLTARVRLNTRDAERSIDNLIRKINTINNTLNRVGSNNQVNQQLGRSNTQANSIVQRIKAWANAQKQVTANTRSTNSVLNAVGTKLKWLASTYLGVMGIRGATQMSDVITSSENRLNQLNGGDAEATQLAMDKMYASAQKVRMAYSDMMSNASKSMTLAGDAFQGNIDNAIRFQEIMAETYALGGASAAEMSSSMYQMIQALGSGTLAGDELRSVREGAPLAYKAIEEFVQGVYNTEESLKELASQGKVTSDMVVAAIMQAGDKIDEQFENTAMTFGQAWDKIKNTAIKAFEPVSQLLNDMLNKAANNGMFEKIEGFFINLSKALQIVFKLVELAVGWIADNWYWLQDVIVAGLSLIASYYIVTTAIAIGQAVIRFALWVMEYWYILLIVVAIAAVIYALYLLQQGAITTTEFLVICAMIIAAAFAIAALVMMSLPMAITAVVIAGLALAFYFFEEVCGGAMWLGAVLIDALFILYNTVAFVLNLIFGVVAWLIATVYNAFIGCINAIIQVAWNAVEPFIGIIEFILNACNGGFNSFGGAVANLIGQIISWFLSLGKVVTKIIDAIFGTDWTSGLNSLQDKVLAWGKKEDAITISREAPELKRISATKAFDIGNSTFNYANLINPMDAYDTGAKWGAGVTDKINQWGSGIVDNFNGKDGNLLDNIGEKLGLDFGKLNSGLPSPTNPAFDVTGAYDMPAIEELLGGISDDTGTIKDSMDLSNDDLEYLRKIAEMEWRNEFTTAEIRVDMTNNNTVSAERDLDGIVEYLGDVLRAEMTNVAYGVHY